MMMQDVWTAGPSDSPSAELVARLAVVAGTLRSYAGTTPWPHAEELEQGLRTLQNRLRHSGEPPRLMAKQGGVMHIFHAGVVSYIRAAGKCSTFSVDGAEHVSHDNIGALATALADHGFYRLHRSLLVNLRRIETLQRREHHLDIAFHGGESVRVHRRCGPALVQRLHSLHLA